MRELPTMLIDARSCALAVALLAIGIAPAALAVRTAASGKPRAPLTSPRSPMCGWCFRHLTSDGPPALPAAASPDADSAAPISRRRRPSSC
jgi:hypothetical protein